MIAINCCLKLHPMENFKFKEDYEFDLIVYGATSFTGKLVTEYLWKNYPPSDSFKWAIAGRDKNKLNEAQTRLSIENSNQQKISIITANSNDQSTLEDLVKRTKVILTTVGPYAKYGSKLVAACAKHGTDYCDLAGETQWISKMIDAHEKIAQKTGARIIHACGFDAIPSDMGVFYLQKHAQEKLQKPIHKIKMYVKAMRGGASGGTIASILNIIKEGKGNRDIARLVSHPYALNPKDKRNGPDVRDNNTFALDKTLNLWTAPFIMSSINTRIVRRSNALMNYPYTEDFSYTESVLCGKNVTGRFKSIIITMVLGFFVLLSSNRMTRKYIIKKMLPKPGEGPTKKQRENGFFKLLMVGLIDEDSLINLEITGDRDPGYGSTSKMLSETAICLACDNINTKGGSWTPASALGEKLLARLESKAGMKFKILEKE